MFWDMFVCKAFKTLSVERVLSFLFHKICNFTKTRQSTFY